MAKGIESNSTEQNHWGFGGQANGWIVITTTSTQGTASTAWEIQEAKTYQNCHH